LKVEITVDELVLLSPQPRLILHDFEEDFTGNTKGYQLAEIVAEKYRALIQSLERLQYKGWGANRVCRDYYDLWWVLSREKLNNIDVPSLVDKKCAVKSVSYHHQDTFFDNSLITVAQIEWDKLLIPLIPETISLDTVI
jgi:predicted nucleotidyltransferase component of viral defense system